MVFRRLLPAVLLLVATAGWAHAHVTASLVADQTSVQPGRPFTVALRLQHEPHWHTYWINAGTGYATSLKWDLPAGWSAGPIQWPTPILIRDRTGAVVGNGYDGEILLPVTLTPPAEAKPGASVTLRAKAEWLMCENVCIPGDAEVSLAVPIRAEPPQPQAPWHERIAALPMPRPADGWMIAAVREGRTVRLSFKPPAGGAAELKNPHFFSEDGFVQFDQPQTVERRDRTTTLLLPVSESADTSAPRLVGVLATSDPLSGLRIDVPFGSPAAAGGDRSFGLIVALALLGGLILNLMPCVFPVLGIKILGFVNQAGADRRKVTLHGLAFTAGVLLCFWSLAALLAALRAGGAELGWGFQLQSPAFVFALAVVLLVFGLSMSGLFEVGLRATGVGASLQSKSGYAGSFFTGVLATVVATPCSAPFLAPALGAAVTLPTGQSFVAFTAIAIGLSAPYLLLSIFPSAVRILPRPGAWMETFKQAMAFLLYGTVAYLVWVLAGQTKDDEPALLSMLLGLTLVAMAAWLYGRYTAPGSKPARVRFGVIGGLLLLAAGLLAGWPRTPQPDDIVWEAWSAERVAALKAQNRIIYVDFTARWCATCQTNKRLVFGSDEVKRTFRERKVATLKGDWTSRDARITAELARWGRSAVPFNLIYKPGQPEPVILPELLTAGTVLQALNQP